jgi:hypothetical protein
VVLIFLMSKNMSGIICFAGPAQYFFHFEWSTKGQLISKGLFGILGLNFSKKRTKTIRSFFGRIEETKSPFEIY